MIKAELTSTDLTMACAMSLWKELFGLICNEKDTFQQFYSRVKSRLFKLKRDKSIDVKDDVFLCAYFSKVIQAP